jgi:hypothetical protein
LATVPCGGSLVAFAASFKLAGQFPIYTAELSVKSEASFVFAVAAPVKFGVNAEFGAMVEGSLRRTRDGLPRVNDAFIS